MKDERKVKDRLAELAAIVEHRVSTSEFGFSREYRGRPHKYKDRIPEAHKTKISFWFDDELILAFKQAAKDDGKKIVDWVAEAMQKALKERT